MAKPSRTHGIRGDHARVRGRRDEVAAVETRRAVPADGTRPRSRWLLVDVRDSTPRTQVPWPPDVFAGTSEVLDRTGLYRLSVSPPKKKTWPPDTSRWRAPGDGDADRTWGDLVDGLARAWRGQLSGSAGPRQDPSTLAPLRDALSVAAEFIAGRSREDLVETSETADGWDGFVALMLLHACADAACGGFGIPDPPDQGEAAYELKANILMASSGTLARGIPAEEFRVFPKMRTPQLGVTLRNCSHHLAADRSEVNVHWRAFPWVERDENTLNILVLPWPEEVSALDFVPVEHPAYRSRAGSARYFIFRAGRRLSASRVRHAIRAAQKTVRHVHAVVLPETAVSDDRLEGGESELAEVERVLAEEKVPILIAGVHRTYTPGTLTTNQAVFAVHFGGRWHEVRQNKHHRWRLDEAQIRRYGLGGVLNAKRDWWEAIEVPRREIAIVSLNGWLTLCPLICEDLARIDPVSRVIRALGPTFVVALLQDGPQLGSRWPARYASVLAEDPGSSVLTVTSVGMATRSEPPGGVERSRAVAHWKDASSGAKAIELEPGADAVLLSTSVAWREERTLDSRSDNGNAAELVLTGVTQVRIGPAAVADPPRAAGAADTTRPAPAEGLTRLAYFSAAAYSACSTYIADACAGRIPRARRIEPELEALLAQATATGTGAEDRRLDQVQRGGADDLIQLLSAWCSRARKGAEAPATVLCNLVTERITRGGEGAIAASLAAWAMQNEFNWKRRQGTLTAAEGAALRRLSELQDNGAPA